MAIVQLNVFTFPEFARLFRYRDEYSEAALRFLFDYYDNLNDDWDLDLGEMFCDFWELTPLQAVYRYQWEDVTPNNVDEIRQRLQSFGYNVIWLDEPNSFLVTKLEI
jgi:8-oxo-dGTP pyrophosphatase MutT (NUDIX family)